MSYSDSTAEVFDDTYSKPFAIRAKRLTNVGRLLLLATLIIYLLRLAGIYRHNPDGFVRILTSPYTMVVFIPLIMGLALYAKYPVVSSLFVACVLIFAHFAKAFSVTNYLLFTAVILLPIISGILGIAIIRARKNATRFSAPHKTSN